MPILIEQNLNDVHDIKHNIIPDSNLIEESTHYAKECGKKLERDYFNSESIFVEELLDYPSDELSVKSSLLEEDSVEDIGENDFQNEGFNFDCLIEDKFSNYYNDVDDHLDDEDDNPCETTDQDNDVSNRFCSIEIKTNDVEIANDTSGGIYFSEVQMTKSDFEISDEIFNNQTENKKTGKFSKIKEFTIPQLENMIMFEVSKISV